ANIYRQQSPEKAEAYIASLSASQRRSIDDIERSLQNDRLAQQAEALENQGKWAQAAALQRQRLALDPGSVWITYRLSQDLWQAGQRSQADTLMRNLAQQKPNDPEQVYAYGLYLSGHDQDRAALAQAQLGDTAAAQQTFNKLIPQAKSQPPSMESAMVLRDGAK
ncbi:tetratricopeptide repeat protein, partial [Enterobacter hormaechei]|uniref:tetratricopeptide repeat protein n=1 Tax=Enterobacter hormaechei TaxID=158836 RepID=UPI003137C26C